MATIETIEKDVKYARSGIVYNQDPKPGSQDPRPWDPRP